ncbi:MAG: MBL fold metallo-hydrolase [Burkholderiales bacterium RIFCSPLOWO2_12_67_14]|jgi:glyoxylase-like metal-dependent hydrolase (beta-lactamase superfamily II)|uniref:MBL fold metallo-hydrolase n=1 Tax=Hydrogenophaga sp. TaxID=1904254 RepID=UPI0008B4FD97|nr:MBL fold metallo-hydrolase [Hydrogenophaga sp.]MDZ4284027.1 MBL fold metallo-hydrolase [Hydrogenophaga sp.]OGB44202.1 MAG: MBL fold metallo-hydrolase [Burkholderiales bacterium RIFCSPLOWO2_12_67_14]OGB77468.1 MAG: MBL fold metallo-hydrolase [Burkholderiales bacterium RIFCSPLOWO2_12_FULL_67_210]
MTSIQLPNGIQVFERGWLSSNNILFLGSASSALVDSGYSTHAELTTGLVSAALQQRPLDLLLNTHLHSDHCGGNAALQGNYPELQTLIPPGHASLVSSWDPVALNYVPSGQHCPRFKFDGLLLPGTDIQLADTAWQIHAAPGHDPHSVILFEPQSRTLISADALWEKGFGVVFPELDGETAFDEVAATFDLIERLDPRWVIPGHGPVFRYRAEVLAYARERLNAFVKNPERHAHHAVKVLLKFRLLEQQQLPFADFVEWAANTRYLQLIHQRFVPSVPIDQWMEQLTQELVRSAVARIDGDRVYNA